MAGSYHASIKEKLTKIIESATAPMSMQDVFDRMEQAICSEREFTEYDLEVTEQHTDPRWKVRTRSMIATMASNEELVTRISRGVYAPLTLAPEDWNDEEPTEQASQTSWLYAFSLPMSPGLLKIGRAGDLEKRMQQHRFQHAKAHLPDAPFLEAAWQVPNAHAAEEAVHGLLKLRSKHYRGSGSGREWFKASVSEVQEMLDLAVGHDVPPSPVSDLNEL
ncbi:GIY-YIG nuclease family protein (plasmid) [Leisingera caerulea]|uniref:GIY-YIG nuclease family protein n=1 Tax=Leisingera caerulea TaxID=506591 RepID=UPI0021A650A6|nr:GIY-YIG nuclease family protein [Leisingera caerulea]UWQ51851.1 GIY-YIG nuclease family protein [Leisingera caerulea]